MARGRVSLADLANDSAGESPATTVTNEEPTAGVSGGVAAPTSVPIEDLSPNPRNPRDVGDLDDLANIVDVQLQPAAVVSRAAYSRLYPDDVITTPWVVVMGNRRYSAAVKYGRPTLEIVVKDELAKDPATLLAAAIGENVRRRDFDVIEEAKAVEALVKECGNAREAARHLGKTDGWVSQRRALLGLAPELQDALRRGELAVRNARELAKVPSEKQVQSWNAHLERETQKRNAGEGTKSNGKPTAPPQFRTVTVALRNFDEKPADLADALIDTLGDEGVTKLLTVIKRRRRA